MSVYRLNPEKFREHYLDIQLSSKPAEWPEDATLLLSFLFNAVDVNELSKLDLADGYLDKKSLDESLRRLMSKNVLIPVPENGAAADKPHLAIGKSSHLIRLLYELSHEFAVFGDTIDSRYLEDLKTIEERLTHIHDELKGRRLSYLNDQISGLALKEKNLKLHFGVPGLRQLEGWVNIEPNPGQLACSMKWPLPFKDGSVDFIYSAHTIEHLFYKAEVLPFLKEVRRVLSDGGIIRIVTPDAEIMGEAYATHDDKLIAFRQGLKHYSFTAMYQSRLEHILRYSGGGVRPWDPFIHKFAYDFETMKNLLLEAGFSEARKCSYMTSPHAAVNIDDQCSAAHQNYEKRYFSLFAEARK